MVVQSTPPTHRAAMAAVASAVRVCFEAWSCGINVVAVFVCQAFHGLTFVGIAPFLPLIREDLQISYSQAGVLFAAATLIYELGAVKDMTGWFQWGFLGISGLCVMGVGLSVMFSRTRHHALGILDRQAAHG